MIHKDLKTISLLIISSTLVACATNAQPLEKPEVFIKTTNVKNVTSGIIRACDDLDLEIKEESERSVICTGKSTTMANILFGTKSGSGVTDNFAFTAIPYGEKRMAKVTGKAWLENQNAYGGIKRTYLDQNPNYNRDLLTLMNTVKTQIEK